MRTPTPWPVDLKKTEQTYCIMRRSGLFEDFIVNGDVGTERVVPLADGRTTILSPPVGDLATARAWTVFDGKKPKTIPLAFERDDAPPSHGAKAKNCGGGGGGTAGCAAPTAGRR